MGGFGVDVIIIMNNGEEKIFPLFISEIHSKTQNDVQIVSKIRRGSGMMKSLIEYLTSNSDLRVSHLTVKFDSDILLDIDVGDYFYKVTFDLGSYKPIVETLCVRKVK